MTYGNWLIVLARRTLAAVIGVTILAGSAHAQIDSRLLAGLKARAIGPATMSGRIAAIDSVASDTNVIYVGAASGGVWKSVDNGLTWAPIFDDQDVAAIGAIAINQQNPDIVWVGTGEGNVRNSTSIGGGIYKSVDGGRTWQRMGLETTERINRIALDPTNPDIAYVAAMGTLWGENEDRGVYRTTDGGKTWSKVLYVDQRTGATDIKIDPSNPQKLFAAMWQFRRWPYYFKSGGPGSGLYVSRDGGDSWQQLTPEDGLPDGELGRAVFAVAPTNSKRVYALVEAETNVLIRSDDGGVNWQTINDTNGIMDRPFYYTELTVDPTDQDTLYNISTRLRRSIDGGRNFSFIEAVDCCSAPNKVHIDNHAFWVDPNNPDHMIIGNDGGIAISYDRGGSWRFVGNLPVAQFYHVRVDNDQPYHIYGGLQDNGSFRGPAEVWENGGIRNFHWQEIGFGDGFDAMPDPDNSMRGFSMSQGGNLYRWNLTTGELRQSYPGNPNPDVPLRFNWNAGLAQDPFDASTIYYGSQFVHKSTDRGRTWEIISPDLTTNNTDWQTFRESGGLTKDVTAAENYTTVISIAPSPVQAGTIWVGTDDGRVHVTTDGGANWASIEGRARGVPPNAWVPHIEASPHDPSVAFVVFDDHRRSNMATYVYRVENFGREWVSLTRPNIRGYALSIKQDPVDPRLLFLGTEFGLYVSTDAGQSWFKFTAGVPTASVMDIAIQTRENDLVLGTHGRAIFVVDNYSALRGLSAADFAQRLALLSVTDGQQYIARQSPSTRFDASTSFRAPNEPYGVAVTFMASGDDLTHPDPAAERARKAAQRQAAASSDEDADDAMDEDTEAKAPPKVEVEVSDADGNKIRSFKADVTQGINRIVWPMTRDAFKPLPGASRREGGGDAGDGPQVPPGTYTVTLKLGDQEISAAAQVLADPRLGLSDADYAARYDTLVRIGGLNDSAITALERIANASRDISTLETLAADRIEAQGDDMGDDMDDDMEGGNAEDDPLKAFQKDAKAAGKKLDDLVALFRTPPGTKGIIFSDDQVMSRIRTANGYVASHMGRPTPASMVFVEQAEATLRDALAEVDQVFAEDVANIRNAAGELGLTLLAEDGNSTLP